MDELEKIEAVKKEADSLMMNKIIKYEAKIAELKKLGKHNDAVYATSV